MRPPRGLSEAEASAWAKLAASVEPLAGRKRPIWLTHAGDDPAIGWNAFFATVPGTGGDGTCLAQWDGASSVFVDSCDPTATWPPDGYGLQQLEWQVVGGELRVAVGGTRPADWETGP